MPRKSTYSSNLHSRQQSTGGRPLIVLCLISVLLLTFYLREGDGGFVHSLRSACMTITAPVRTVGAVAASPFNALGNAFSNASASSETLEELRRENERLTAEVAELTEAQHAAERLEALDNLKKEYKLTGISARIIGSAGNAWSSSVIIDKGSKDGFEIGMPVCSSGGVIGQIVEVSSTTSTVRLITDEQSGVSAMVQASRAQGTLKGQADGTLRLEYVVADAEVSSEDIVVTSGLGGVFPKGLPLGTVSSVERSSNDVYYSIVVRPFTLAENNEEVLVITSIEDDQVASDEDVASANKNPQGGNASAAKDSSDGDSTTSDDDRANE